MDWKFGWSALAAIGSLLAAIAAFVASSIALKIARQEWDKEKEQEGQKALMYKWLFMGEINSLQAIFETLESEMKDYLNLPLGSFLTNQMCVYLNDLSAGMSAPLIERHLADLHILGIKTGRAVAGIIANISMTQESITTLTMGTAQITNENKEIVNYLLIRLGLVQKYYSQFEWPAEPS